MIKAIIVGSLAKEKLKSSPFVTKSDKNGIVYLYRGIPVIHTNRIAEDEIITIYEGMKCLDDSPVYVDKEVKWIEDNRG